MPEIVIDYIGGNCPVEVEGTIDGKPFYFRARGEHYTLGVGADPIGSPDWFWREQYSPEKYAAGWMTEDEARAFLDQMVAHYAAGVPSNA